MAVWEINRREYDRLKTKYANLFADPDFLDVLALVDKEILDQMDPQSTVEQLIAYNEERKALQLLTGRLMAFFNEKVAEKDDERDD